MAMFLGWCSGHSLVASYFGPYIFSSLLRSLESLVLSFLFEDTNWSFH